jgi:hypothetical protein
VFKPEDTHVLIGTPDQVFAEYTAHTAAALTFGEHSTWLSSATVHASGDRSFLYPSYLHSRSPNSHASSWQPPFSPKPSRSMSKARLTKKVGRHASKGYGKDRAERPKPLVSGVAPDDDPLKDRAISSVA